MCLCVCVSRLVYSSVDGRLVPTFLAVVILLWTLVYTYLFKSWLSLLWGVYPEVELLDPMGILCGIFEELPHRFLQQLQHFTLLPAQGFQLLHILTSTLAIFCGFDNSHSWLERIRRQCRRPGFDPWVGKLPWRRERLPTPILWPGEFHGLFHGISKSQTLSDFHLHTLVCVSQSQSLRTSDLPLPTW